MADEHEHKWRSVGIWDGRTPEGKPTGGLMYKCDVCGEQIQGREIDQKGGTIVEGTDVFGKPLSPK